MVPWYNHLQDVKKYRQLEVESVLRPHQYVVEQRISYSYATLGVFHVARGGRDSDSTLFERGVTPRKIL
jgi:hypothetical protein